MSDVLALIAIIVAGAGMLIDAARAILHFTAPRTATTWDDRQAAKLDALHDKLAVIETRLPPAPATLTVKMPIAGGPGAALLCLLLLGLGSAQICCSSAQRTAVGSAVVHCTAANAGAIGGVAASMEKDCAGDGKTNWKCVRGEAVEAGLAIGGCAFLRVVATYPATAARSSSAAAPADDGRAEFERYRAEVAGGAVFQSDP